MKELRTSIFKLNSALVDRRPWHVRSATLRQREAPPGYFSPNPFIATLGFEKRGCGGGFTVPVVETKDLAKKYGKVQALESVSLAVEAGEVFGLLGQNGAGKTTLVKILLGITRATSGEARLLGRPPGRPDVLRRVGYLPEDHRFPDYHSGFSLLDFYGGMLGLARRVRRRRIPEVLGLVGLKGRMHYKIRTYSKGMKQRVGIAQAIFHDPEIIFLDEPTDGVDPLGRREIRKLLLHLKEQGKTVFVNSHLLGEVELLCDRVAILQRGAVIRTGEIARLTRQQGLFVIGLAEGEVMPCTELENMGYGVCAAGDLWEVCLEDGQAIDAVVDWLRGRGLHLRHLVEKRQTLEDLFMETVVAAEPGVDAPLWSASANLGAEVKP
jgi:ABC-2 type transport system ATP-binding protein